MPSKRHKPEEIMGKQREVEIVLSRGGTTAEGCRRIGVTEQTYYRWRKEYGGLKVDQARADEGSGEGEPSAPSGSLRLDARQAHSSGGCQGKLLSPAWRPRCIDRDRSVMLVSERRICRVLGQRRSTQRKVPHGADDEAALTEDIIELARRYGRYGYRPVTALLHAAGWTVSHMA